MKNKKVRVRFAPSPTGGLHLGGVRTVLYNYLFARQMGGDFVLRIEDTDQTRYVPGAEEYIYRTLDWCGLTPDESPVKGGDFGPYRQSERKASYRPFAEKLVAAGHAYYAFDTPEALEQMREKFKTPENPSPQYDRRLRHHMHNSLNLSTAETDALLAAGTPHVIRIKVPDHETVKFTDLIRGEVSFDTALLDDKVLLKGDGMPTYHLAVVVDDAAMEISHAFRGEEWLPSAPIHVLLWRYLFGEDRMPQWAHFPLILKPDGNGKLSKRDGARLGIPVFAMDWTDANTGETVTGFKENGFLPEAFDNMLAMLGWNAGTEQEIFSLFELIETFSLDQVHKSGARFNFEKAKWFNQEWIKKLSADDLLPRVKPLLAASGVATADDAYLKKIIGLVKDRCVLLTDFPAQARVFFTAPETWDLDAVKPKWTEAKTGFFTAYQQRLKANEHLSAAELEADLKAAAGEKGLKAGEVMLPLRIMLVGEKSGPHVFDIVTAIGIDETNRRIQKMLAALPNS